MRVLLLTNLYPPVVVGGAERYAATLAGRLRERGHEVAAMTLAVEGDEVVAAARQLPLLHHPKDGADQSAWRRALFHLADLYNPLTTRTLRQAVGRFAPDVVHSHAVQGLSTAALLGPSRLGLPHVHTLHDYWLLCQRNSLLRRGGRSCQVGLTPCRAISHFRSALARRHFADVVLSPSADVLATHRRFPALPADARVLRHATEAVASRPPRPDRPVTFGYIGQITAHKGVATLLDAVGRLPSAHLLVAGDGPLAGRVRASTSSRVTYRGVVAEAAKDAFFRDIDCLVVPSEWAEPAGLVISEARARRVPVIGSDLGGTPEYVPASCRPLLFPAGDVGALAAAMREFASRPLDFPVVDTDLGPTWDEHVDGVLDAYASARARHEVVR